MDNQDKNATDGGLVALAAKLNEIGTHYFVGWLVSAGFQKPGIMEEIDRALQDMENDPALAHCTLQENPAAAMTTECERTLPPAAASPAVAAAECAVPADLTAPPNPLVAFPRPAGEPARGPRFVARLLAAFFHRPRMAA